MILVCPSCDSKFNVPDGAIPPAGRKVRCAKCQHSWHATLADELKPARTTVRRPSPAAVRPAAEEVDAGAAARAAAIRKSFLQPEPESAASEHDDDPFNEAPNGQASQKADEDEKTPAEEFGIGAMFSESASEDGVDNSLADDREDDGLDHHYEDDDGDDDDILAHRRADLRRQSERKSLVRKRKLILGGWIALVLFWLTVLFVTIGMKETVVAAYPGTSSLYSAFSGLSDTERFRPEEGVPLTKPITETEVYVSAKLFENLTRIDTIDGKQQLVISGVVENTGNRAANVPLVEISIKDGSGRVIDQWNYEPEGLVLRRHGEIKFEVTRFPIPTGMRSVEVRSLDGTRSTREAAQG